MHITVHKYGGTSVADVDRIEAIAERISKSKDDRLLIVVSAMDQTTDELLEMAHQISHHPPARELDMLLTAGERITMSLLSMALWKRGIQAISFTGSQSGIITDDLHNSARIIEVRGERIIGQLQRGQIVIVAGFQGVSGSREVTTLGRGGSDTTAIVLAHAVGADKCEIYTDVEGIMTADPNIVDKPRKIESVNCDILLDMAIFGAGVIHPRAVEVARRFKIPIEIKSSVQELPGTIVCTDNEISVPGDKTMERSRVEAVTKIDNVALVKGNVDENVFIDFIGELKKARISTMHPNFRKDGSERQISFWIHDYDMNKIGTIKDSYGLDIIEEYGIVSVTGFELFSDLYILQELIETASKVTEIQELSSTSVSFYVFVDKDKTEEVVRKIHSRFIAR